MQSSTTLQVEQSRGTQPHTTAVHSARPGRLRHALQRGISMLELSLVLIVVAIVLAGVYFGFSQNQRRVEVSENISVVSEIISTMQARFGKTNQYANVTTAVAVQTRAFPENLRIGVTNTAQNSYGGLITVAPATCVSANDCVTLTWAGVPRPQCSEVIIGTQQYVRRVQIGVNDIKPLDGALNLALLATTCDGAGPHTIAYTFGRGA